MFTYGLADRDRHQVYCSFCSFRPWADTSEVVTFERAGGRRNRVSAAFDPSTKRWRTSARLRPNQSAHVEAGGVVDTFGNANGAPSGVVVRGPGPR